MDFGDITNLSDPMYIRPVSETTHLAGLLGKLNAAAASFAAALANGTVGGQGIAAGSNLDFSQTSGVPSAANGPWGVISTPPVHNGNTTSDPPCAVIYQLTAVDVLWAGRMAVLESFPWSVAGAPEDTLAVLWTMTQRFALMRTKWPDTLGKNFWGPAPNKKNRQGLLQAYSEPLMPKNWKKESHKRAAATVRLSWDELAAKYPKKTNLVLDWARGHTTSNVDHNGFAGATIHFANKTFTKHKQSNPGPHRTNWKGQPYTDGKNVKNGIHPGHPDARSWQVVRGGGRTNAHVTTGNSRRWPKGWVTIVSPDGVAPAGTPTKPSPTFGGPADIVIIGDSGLGNFGDERGTFARALRRKLKSMFQGLTDEKIFIRGVSGAHTGAWVEWGIHGRLPKGPNWKKVSQEQLRQMTFANLKAKNPKLVIVNMGSNDFSKQRKESEFAANATKIISQFNCPVLWFTGPHSTSYGGKKAPYIRRASKLAPFVSGNSATGRFFWTSASLSSQAIFGTNSNPHPSVGLWNSYLNDDLIESTLEKVAEIAGLKLAQS